MGSGGKGIALLICAFAIVPLLGGSGDKGKLGAKSANAGGHKKFKCYRIECRWVGTAPFCEGGCSDDEVTVNSSKEGDGMPCWTGTKHKCCKKTQMVTPSWRHLSDCRVTYMSC